MTASLQTKNSDNYNILCVLKPQVLSSSEPVDVDAWITRMKRVKELGHFSDQDMIFMVGDYLIDVHLRWYQVMGTDILSWSEFTSTFRTLFIDEDELILQKGILKQMFLLSLERATSQFNMEEFRKYVQKNNHVFVRNRLTDSRQ
ncbi:hypothetical protein K501DRAFT_315729 [Backusella circina FSU 941]|nr:hypothetical protein K501DRAFT_315729 [Backusella circina FSU 941]